MPKPISNYDQPENKNLFPTLACNLTTQGKLPLNQLYCCHPDGSCDSKFDLSNCAGGSNIISKCQRVRDLDACQKRNDTNSVRVCEWINDYFCLSEPSTSSFRPEYFEGIKWKVSRNTLEESRDGAIACYNGTGYQLCNAGGTNVTCGDLFSKDYICAWKKNYTDRPDESINRSPLGELCENFVVPTATEIAITTPVTLLEERNGLAVGTAIGGFGILVLGVIATFLYRSRKRRGRKLAMRDQQIDQQGTELENRQSQINKLQKQLQDQAEPEQIELEGMTNNEDDSFSSSNPILTK